jgi:hypothetical protein
VRAEFERLCRDYPNAPAWRDPGFAGHPVARLLRIELPDALKRALPTLLDPYVVDGSAGDGSWTHTPWVAVLDPKVTTTVQEGVYVVYLLSLGGERLYLTLNQGCTRLKDGPAGIPGARQELVRRREMIWRRLQPSANRLRPISVDSNVERRVWRGKLYELGAVAGVEYPASALPSEKEMAADLAQAVGLYRTAIAKGGWAADDGIEREALDDDIPNALTQAKVYRVHRSIERQLPVTSLDEPPFAELARRPTAVMDMSRLPSASAYGGVRPIVLSAGVHFRCCARCLFISNMVTLSLPKTLRSLLSARISRRSSGFCRLFALM